MLLHLDCVRQDHVQIKHEVLNLVMEHKSIKNESAAADGRPAGSRTINLHLVWKCGLSQLQVFFCIGEDGLQRATQKLLIKILRCSHQWWKRHGHLHLDSCKVLKTVPWEGRNEVEMKLDFLVTDNNVLLSLSKWPFWLFNVTLVVFWISWTLRCCSFVLLTLPISKFCLISR